MITRLAILLWVRMTMSDRFHTWASFGSLRDMMNEAKKHRRVCGRSNVRISQLWAVCVRCGWNYVPLTFSALKDESEVNEQEA